MTDSDDSDESKYARTETINLDDYDVSTRDVGDVSPRRATAPPPLPPNLPPPPEAVRSSVAPSRPSFYPPPSVAPAPKLGPWVYVLLVVMILIVALGSGAIVAAYVRRDSARAEVPSKPSVITIPTVEMDDAPDGGP